MGEVKIKSGNFFDVNGEHTSLVWDGKECLVIENDAIIVNQIRPGYMTGIYYDEVYKPGTYTFAMKQLAAQSDKTAISVVSSAPFAGGVYNDAYKAYTAALVKHDDTHYITIVVTEPTEIGFFINGYFSVNDKIYDIQLLEGTYTSETIPEYQPYFLNRPAHQVTNGQWVDIPTHHYTNGRWQGELTSQSPLKFWADGEMLDWRIEGKTSGNLFDLSTDLVTHLGFSSTSGGIISIKSTNNAIGFYVKCQPDKYYTLSRATNTNNRFSIGFTADEPVDGTPLLSYTPFETSDTSVTALSPSNANYICAYLTNQYDPITDDLQLMLNEGSTALPYESYGGVGDWDETAQRYKIPVTVEGENLFDPETSTPVYIDTRGNEYPSEKSLTSDYISVNANTMYTLGQTGDTDSTNATAYCFYNSNKECISGRTYVPSAEGNIVNLLTPNDCAYFRFTYNHLRELVEFVEGSYTTLPPYSTTTNLFTDHQLMDGDSIDYATDQTAIPIATGNNTLTVDTAVQPKSVFVKFEG